MLVIEPLKKKLIFKARPSSQVFCNNFHTCKAVAARVKKKLNNTSSVNT